MAHLTGQVEHDVRTECRGAHVVAPHVGHVGLDDCNAPVGFGAVVGYEVPRVRAMPVDARIEDRDLGAVAQEGEREIRSDEAQATGDEAPTTGEGVARHEVQSAISLGVVRSG